MADSYGQSKSMDKRLLAQGKTLTAKDIIKIIETSFNDRIEKRLEGYAGRDAKRALRTTLDETLPWFEAYVEAVKKDHGITIVKLRDDEKSPVAAPCAIAGACQYGKWEPEIK